MRRLSSFVEAKRGSGRAFAVLGTSLCLRMDFVGFARLDESVRRGAIVCAQKRREEYDVLDARRLLNNFVAL